MIKAFLSKISIIKFLYSRLLSWYLGINKILPKFFYKNKFTSLVYYILFSTSFYRELQSVLAGKVKYIRDSKGVNTNYFQLVRNIHRLEKGLLMRPRRDVFAKGYIKETVNSYVGVINNAHKFRPDQLEWFHDVLEEYFNVTESDHIIDRERIRFIKVNRINKINKRSNKKIPYKREEFERVKISFEDFMQLSKQRRSVRWFKDEPVSRDLIDKAFKVAIQAPSACNRQPFEYKVFDNKDMVNEIANIPMGTKGYAHNIQILVVVVGNLDAYFDERDRHLIYIDASLANMAFMYALETLGLSSCSINWPDIEEKEKKLAKKLKLQLHQRPIMLMAIGYADKEGRVAYSEKRPLDMIRTYNK